MRKDTKIQILPSLLAGDFGNLRGSARKAEAAGADALHVDIMDSHFAPNLSMGPDVVRMAHDAIQIPLSVHLMMTRPDSMAEAFIESGSDLLLIHIEADCDVPGTLEHIRAKGAKPGITLNPATPADSIFDLLDNGLVDEVLCMSVVPGFGGQSFMPEVFEKIRRIRRRITEKGLAVDISVDGGITATTGPQTAAHGANALIAGSFLFKAADMAREVAALRAQAQAAFDDGV